MQKQGGKIINKRDPGAAQLNKQYPDLSTSRNVWRSVGDALYREDKRCAPPEQSKNYTRAKNANVSSETRIARFLERLERVITREAVNPNRESGYSRLQQELLRNAVINTNDSKLVAKIAEGIFTSEKKVALERGHGQQARATTFERFKEDYVKLVHEKRSIQLSSLSEWSDYLFKNDAQHPAWFRYVAIRSVLKMGDFDRDTPKFATRSKDTIAAFPELNAEALGFVFKALSEPTSIVPKTESLIEPFRAALKSKSFSALYAVALVECNQSINRSRLEGQWRKYNKGSDHTLLENDLSGKGTGWCTATGSAAGHIEGGDFYVYYTKDETGEFSVPRVAIRMENEEIVEIRGIAPGQELEPEFLDVVEEKGKTLPGYEYFKKASADMKLLTAIDKRCHRRDAEGNIEETLTPNPPLSKDELGFLYEVESTISSFGNRRDPRIKQVISTRADKSQDYATIYDVDISQVVTDKSKITEHTRVYLGDLSPEDYKILDGRKGPLVIFGRVDLSGSPITSIPARVVFKGDADFDSCISLTSIGRGVVFHGKAEFDRCTSLTSIGAAVVFNKDVTFFGCRSLILIGRGAVFNQNAFFWHCPFVTFFGAGMFKEYVYFERWPATLYFVKDIFSAIISSVRESISSQSTARSKPS